MPLKSGPLHNVLFSLKKSKKKASPEGIKDKELSDEQMVQQAIDRSRRFPLTVEDLFQTFGEFSPMYIRSIILNSLVWGIGELHYRTDHFISQSSKHFRFIDKRGIFYGDKDNQIGNHVLDEIDAYNMKTLVSCFNVIGVILVLCRYKTGRRQMVLQCGILYAISSLLFLIPYEPIIRAGIALATMFNKAIRVVILMDFGESVPPRLLPFAWAFCYLLTGALSVLCNIILRYIDSWKYLGLAIGMLYAIGVVFYYFLVPPGIILALAELRAEDIWNAVRKWSKGKEETLDVNALIDDTMFHGQPVVSAWSRVRELMFVRPFMIKSVILILLWTVPAHFDHIGRMALDERQSMQYYDRMLLFSVFSSLGPIIGVYLIQKYGRRGTCLTTMMTGILAVLVICLMRLEDFDLCSMTSIPTKDSRYVSGFAIVILVMTSTALEVVLLVVVLHHIPVEQHSILVPLFLVPVNIMRAIYTRIENEDWWEIDPNQNYMMALFYSCFCIPFVIGLDNSSHMTLSAADIPCYRFKTNKYPENPVKNDFPAAEYDTISDSSMEV